MPAADARPSAALDLVTLVRHMEWADARLWGAVLALPAERAAPAMLEKLHHIHYVQAVFFARARGEQGMPPQLASFDGLGSVAAWARDRYPGMHAAVAAIDDAWRTRPVPAPPRPSGAWPSPSPWRPASPARRKRTTRPSPGGSATASWGR